MRRKIAPYLQEIEAYIRVSLPKNQISKHKFIIFGMGRSGSILLIDLLNNHPEIYCEEEILNVQLYKKVLFPNMYLQGKRAIFSNKVYGCKISVHHFTRGQNINPEKFMLKLEAQKWKIINLRRNNYLRSEISLRKAIQINQWHIKSPSSLKNGKITIDCNELLKGLERREKFLLKEQEILKKLDHIKVTYEDDLLLQENHQKTCNRLFAYLGLKPLAVKTKLVKTTSDQLSDVIENYEEVLEKLSQTKYATFLS